MKNEDFIKLVGTIIKEEAINRGYNYPSAIIAQACLESKYGRSGLAKYHNYFGLKCGGSWKGGSVNMGTKEEYQPGTEVRIRDNFRTYENLKSGIIGYFDFISAKRYSNLKKARSAEEYLRLIKEDGYATASDYVKNNIAVINKYDLKKYDNFVEPNLMYVRPEIDIVAREVIEGKWGNGANRRIKLKRAGYNYNAVQEKVNEILRGE